MDTGRYPLRPITRRRALAGALLFPAVASSLLACAGNAAPSPTSAPATPPPPAAPVSTNTPAPSATPAPTSTAAGTPTARATRADGSRVPSTLLDMPSPDSAVQVFLWGNPNTDRDLKLAKDAGFGWVKQSIEWRYVEPHVKGKLELDEPDRVVKAVNAAGLKLIARVDNQPVWARAAQDFPVIAPPDKLRDFGDYVGALATRYRGKIHGYEIWNEPNLAREWGNKPPDPKGYVELLKVAYKAIKAADPEAIVISGGLAPTTASGDIAMPDADFLKAMYAAGLKGSVDMVGVHAAGYKAPPETSPADIAKNPAYNHGEGAAGRIYGFRHVEDLREIMVSNGDAGTRIAITEMGWTADPRPDSPYKWHSVTEAEKGDYLARAFKFAKANWSPWIGVSTVIYISAPHWTEKDEMYYWCITGPDGSVRPSYLALQKALKP